MGDEVVLDASLYACSVFVACLFLLSSRHLITFKRWYDFSFLYGLALLAWGLGHLFEMHPAPLLQFLSSPVTFLFYLFLLLSFHAFPLSPHLYYDRWKTTFDVVIITSIYLTTTITIWNLPGHAWWYIHLLHLQGSLFILGRAFTIFMGNTKNSQRDHNNLLLISAALFLLVDATGHDVFKLPMQAATIIIFIMMLIGLRKMGKLGERVNILDEYLYFHEKLSFQIRDDHVNRFYLFVLVIILLVLPEWSSFYMWGMIASLLLLSVRIYLTRRANNESMKEMFGLSRSLEKQFEENMHEIRQKNDHLSNLLSVKQSYEKLLMESNRQNMQQIDFENLHTLIEEIADVWHDNMIGLDYLRISLQSKEGDDYYEIERGCPQAAGKWQQRPFSLSIKVEEHIDTPYVPDQIVIDGLTSSFFREDTELEDSFFNLLAIHVRGLIHRCLQNQQALELRLVEKEMELAARIQLSLIPKERLRIPSLEAKAVYLPAASVGGDYVDYITVHDRYTCFLVADVAGHGIPASLLTNGLRSYFRAVVQTYQNPDDILTRLNQLLYEDLSQIRSYITMFVAVYDQEEKIVRTSRAGHPQPFYLSATKQTLLPCSNGLGLGLQESARYRRDEWPVEEDFTLIIYTDGLIDLGRKEGAMTADQWLQRFHAVSCQLAPGDEDRIAAIEKEVGKLTKTKQQEDDLSLLILSFSAAT
ncbi:PP2C family protein-serine/threonine phosphatase [Brevibacillus migulae]|uniref:PP2C family protein-serine/threonine phosphatase n=1 Tax=Brevibacillus migulae TaxID=1644114 RepID=UPI00106E1147|nr:PP2C family protein-serine/threonine phosphatase [Brevibacillus migulae]